MGTWVRFSLRDSGCGENRQALDLADFLGRGGMSGVVKVTGKLKIEPKLRSIPKSLSRLRAVSGVIPRLPRTSSLIRG